MNLKFSVVSEVSTIPFLDLILKGNIDTGRIETATYRKEVAGNTLLSAKSCHPIHPLKAIPICELVRSKRNCSDSIVFHNETNNIFDGLAKRNYSNWMLNRSMDRVKAILREVLLQDKNKIDDERGRSNMRTNKRNSVFSTPYTVEFKSISNIINKYIPVLHADPELQQVLNDGIKVVVKKAPTLSNILSPSMVKSSKARNPTWLQFPGCFKCSHRRCICCNHLEVSNHFISIVTNKQYSVKQYINCNTTYVVYLITCSACSTQYVGSTTCSLKTRVRRHLSDVNSLNFNQISSVSSHCIQFHDRKTDTLKIQGIDQINISERGGDHVRKLRSHETFWIFSLQTCRPLGMNKRLDLDLHY